MKKELRQTVLNQMKKLSGKEKATYKKSKDMSDELRKALPDIEDLKRLPDENEE